MLPFNNGVPSDPMRSMLSIIIASLLIPALPVRVFSSALDARTLAEALRVMRLIDGIEQSPSAAGAAPRKAVISESELNSYIAYRIETEKEQILKELQLKLLDDNHFEGRMLIDLRGQNYPSGLRPLMNLFFSGQIRIGESKAKIDINSLFLEKQRVQPLLLDLLIYFSAKLDNAEATSLGDWYELPFGLRDLKISKGSLTALY